MIARLGTIGGVLARDLSPALGAAIGLGAVALGARPACSPRSRSSSPARRARGRLWHTRLRRPSRPRSRRARRPRRLGLDLAARLIRPALLASLLTLAVALVPLGTHFAAADAARTARRASSGRTCSRRSRPDDALREGDNQVFLLAYLTAACAERPDVTVIDRDGNLFADFYGLRGEADRIPPADFQRHRLATEVAALNSWFAADPDRPCTRRHAPICRPPALHAAGDRHRLSHPPARSAA